jgi:hypothetical protein
MGLAAGWLQRNDLHKGFCPQNVLANPAEGCMWNGKPCGGSDGKAAANKDAVGGPEYSDELFDTIMPKRKSAHGGGGGTVAPPWREDQFLFGAHQYDYPCQPKGIQCHLLAGRMGAPTRWLAVYECHHQWTARPCTGETGMHSRGRLELWLQRPYDEPLSQQV